MRELSTCVELHEAELVTTLGGVTAGLLGRFENEGVRSVNVHADQSVERPDAGPCHEAEPAAMAA